MKKALIWVALGLMSLGIALFVGVGIFVDFDFMRLDNMKYITNSYEISESFSSVELDTATADIDFRLSEDGKCSVVCYEQENATHDVSVKDGVLVISWRDSRNWVEHITVFNFNTPTITVYLPKGEYYALKVSNTTGDVKLNGDWSMDEVSLKTTTGDIYASGMTCKGDVSVYATTGDVKLEDITCKNLTAEGSTGKAELKNVIASATVRIKRTTGDIKLHQCDGEEIYLNTTTGDITGTLLTSKVISAHATTGDVDVPKFTSGGRCEINTTTGDICIRID